MIKGFKNVYCLFAQKGKIETMSKFTSDFALSLTSILALTVFDIE